MIPVFKKGDHQQCSNYRGITLLSLPKKVNAKVLERRLCPIGTSASVVFFLVVEHWTSSFSSWGYLSLQRVLPTSLHVLCEPEGIKHILQGTEYLLQAIVVRAWSTLLAISCTCSQLVSAALVVQNHVMLCLSVSTVVYSFCLWLDWVFLENLLITRWPVLPTELQQPQLNDD